MDLKKNEPKLADVRAPWDAGWGYRDALNPRNFWRGVVFNFKHRGFWAPTEMNSWRYRLFLRDLDEVCLRSLKSHGALTARELAEWLNRRGLLRTRSKRTGISRISVATAHDWINLARRRSYVVAWEGDQSEAHWELTEQGREAVHSRLMAFMRRFPFQSLLVGGAGLLALLGSFLSWLSIHQAVLAWIVIAVSLAIVVGATNFILNRFERRAAPGVDVVAIETLRSAGRPLPTLSSWQKRSRLPIRR